METKVYVLITETRHGTPNLNIFFSEEEALEAFDDFQLNRQGDSKALYQKEDNSSYATEIKSEES